MVDFIYLLCAATALMCSVLLWRGYRENRIRLLFWSSLCFLGLAVENVLLYLDRVTYPNVDLSMYRQLVGLAALTLLIYSMIWESK
ncbi:MAG: hypothetical protein B7Z74_09955 [Deltaproteobacteria bacterium 21-66-5]|nr:MAG: hypothetical protein B7Z74_09955 [Deltaproteobacteria bacterium 21-66-5]